MRYHEISGGIQIVVTNSEKGTLKKIASGKKLSPQDKQIADRLVSKGVVDRNSDNKYTVIKPQNQWRHL